MGYQEFQFQILGCYSRDKQNFISPFPFLSSRCELFMVLLILSNVSAFLQSFQLLLMLIKLELQVSIKPISRSVTSHLSTLNCRSVTRWIHFQTPVMTLIAIQLGDKWSEYIYHNRQFLSSCQTEKFNRLITQIFIVTLISKYWAN